MQPAENGARSRHETAEDHPHDEQRMQKEDANR